LIQLLIWALVLVLVFGVVFYVIQLLPLPAPWGNIAIAIVALIFVLILISALLGELPIGRPLLR